MREEIKIVQIFRNVDLRKGENSLAKLITNFGYSQNNLMNGYVHLFVSRDGYKVKILGNDGVIRQEMPNPWDFNVPVEKAVLLLCKAFLFNWDKTHRMQEVITFGKDRVRNRRLREWDEKNLHSKNL